LTNISVEVGGKHLEYLRLALPKLKAVAVMVNTAISANQVYSKRVEAAAGILGIGFTRVLASDLGQIESAIRQLTKDRNDALILSPDALFSTLSSQIARIANENRVPTMFWTREHVVAGGFMSYGQNNAEHYYRAPAYIDKLLKGAKPADLPIEQPTKIELVVNSATARALGIVLPQELLHRADEVIE
jgi:putative ABC transport system substrate-binding protein